MAVLVLVAIAASMVAPVLDHHAAEREPGHSHLVLGSAVEGAHALATHLHGYELPHSHSPTGQAKAAPGVVGGQQVLAVGGGEAASVYGGIAAEVLLAPQGLSLPIVFLYIALTVSTAKTLVEAIVPVPKVPPRADFSLAVG